MGHHPRERHRAADASCSLFPVGGIHRRDVDPDADLAATGLGHVDVDELQHIARRAQGLEDACPSVILSSQVAQSGGHAVHRQQQRSLQNRIRLVAGRRGPQPSQQRHLEVADRVEIGVPDAQRPA